MPRNLDIALEDVLTAIARIEEAADGVDFVRFSSDWRTRYIIELCPQIISEASRAIPNDLKALHPDIKWIGVRDIGNVLRHQYGSVSPVTHLECHARRIAKASSGDRSNARVNGAATPAPSPPGSLSTPPASESHR